jgi:predicted PurR-regulated permease PerM
LENPNSIKPTALQLPYNIRLCIQLLSFVLVIFILIEGQAIFVPLYLSVLISILLLPIANLLERINFPRALSSLVSVLFAFAIISLIIYFLSAQIISFLNDIPTIKIHLAAHYQTLQKVLEQKLNISLNQQQSLFNSASEDVQSSGLVYAKQTFYTLSQTLAFIIFIIIYSFLILFYRSTIKSFLMVLFSKENKKSIDEVINSAKKVLKNYMSGLLIEMAIIAISNSLLLMIIGLKYAIFLGVFTAVLNIMPFIGIYAGIIFTALVALTTDASMSQIVWMIIGLLVIHFIDANF